jgi:superoxide dismutase, Fe-Mn family
VQTLEYHHGKHHAAYVTKLNAAIASDSSLADKTLEEIMLASSGGVFNNAGQVLLLQRATCMYTI